MGSLILCHKVKARQPYIITRIHCRIYTIEELCYFLCNNIYLIDYTIMNEQLCRWLERELEMESLATKLRELLQNHSSIELFILTILTDVEIYTQVEINHIKNVLERLKNDKDIERQKYKANDLLENGEVEEAILVYQALLNGERDESLPPQFYGKVYGCLGAAYGRIFLYEESMEMYDKAFQICSDSSMLVAYIYAAFQCLPTSEYQKLLEKSEVFQDMNEMIQKDLNSAKSHIHGQIEPSEALLKYWKKQYRRGHS